MISGLSNFANEVFYACDFGAVGGNGDRFGTWLEVREFVEGCDSCFAGGCLSGGYVDFSCARLEESTLVSRDYQGRD